jgi:hypothetical protein
MAANDDLNYAAGCLVQAMLGLITPNWRAVFVTREHSEISVTFILATESVEDRNGIEDVTLDYEALLPDCGVSIVVIVNDLPLGIFPKNGRLVYRRKE